MKVSIAEPEACRRVLSIEVPAEDVSKEYEKNVAQYLRTAQIKGFRPGKAPRAMILSRYDAAIKGKTVEDLVNQSYEEACRQQELVPVSRAKIDQVDFQDNEPLKFQAELEIEPTVELKEYKGLGVKVAGVEVKDKDVDTVVEDLRERLASFHKLDRPSKKGDYIRYEYTRVLVDGKERSDHKNPSYPVPIGDSKIKEFNKALVGVKAGDSLDIEFRFPKDHEAEEVRGQKAEFSIKVNELLEKTLPEVDAGFAKKIGQYETVEQMRQRIQEDLSSRRAAEAQRRAQEEIIAKIVAANDISVPGSRVESYAESMYEDMKKRMPQLKHEEVIERYRQAGELEIKRYKILDWVAKTENIKATQEEVDGRIKEYADARGEKFEAMKEQLRQNGTALMIRSEIRERKTVEWLIENNK